MVNVTRCTSTEKRITTKTLRFANNRLEVLDFSAGKFFEFEQLALPLREFAQWWATQPADTYFVHGTPTVERGQRRHKNGERELTDEPVSAIWVDIDKVSRPEGIDPLDIAAQAAYVVGLLPAAFKHAAYAAGGSTKAGTSEAGGFIKLRFLFELAAPTELKRIKRIMGATGICDTSLYTASQPIYTAAPICVGFPDPFIEAGRPRVICVDGGTVDLLSSGVADIDLNNTVIGRPAQTENSRLANIRTATDKHTALNRETYAIAVARLEMGEGVDGVAELALAALRANAVSEPVADWGQAEETVRCAIADAVAKTVVGGRSCDRDLTLAYGLCSRDKEEKVVSCEANVNTLCLGLVKLFGYNVRRRELTILRPPPWVREENFFPRTVRDSDYAAITKLFAEKVGYNSATASQVTRGLGLVASKCLHFDPVADYLNALPVVGGEAARITAETWLIRYAGAEDNAYTRAVSMKWLIAAVARVYAPGCVAREVLTLVGPQNVGKSSLLRNLCPTVDLFRDDLSFRNEDSPKRGLLGAWIVELAEIDKLTRADKHGDLKAFIGSTVDKFDVKYQKNEESMARMSLLAATTNEETPFSDQTGNTRFNVVRIPGAVDHEGVGKTRDALWGAAVALFKAGVAWHLQGEELVLAGLEQERSRYKSEAEVWLLDYIERPKGSDAHPVEDQWDSSGETRLSLTMEELLQAAKTEGVHVRAQNVGNLLKHMGWEKKQGRINGKKGIRWYRWT